MVHADVCTLQASSPRLTVYHLQTQTQPSAPLVRLKTCMHPFQSLRALPPQLLLSALSTWKLWVRVRSPISLSLDLENSPRGTAHLYWAQCPELLTARLLTLSPGPPRKGSVSTPIPQMGTQEAPARADSPAAGKRQSRDPNPTAEVSQGASWGDS